MAFDKKEYNRQRHAEKYIEFKQRKDKVIEDLGNQCDLCDDPHDELHLHHRYYHPIESNYPRHSKSMHVRWKRLLEVEAHPERFGLLCPSCHRGIEALKFLTDTKKISFEDLVRYIG